MANSKELHHSYYLQFATSKTYKVVKSYIGEKDIKLSTDPHFNDIPLHRWDRLHELMIETSNRKAKKESDGTDKFCWSLSDSVCVAKTIAREIRGHQ